MRSLTILFILFGFTALGQKFKAFEGKLTYNVSIEDTSLTQYFEPTLMYVYTNDTIVRTENNTAQFGLQVALKHLALQKSYILLQTNKGKFAIQTKKDSSEVFVPSYTFKKKWWGKKIAGKRAKRVLVYHELFEEPKLFYYYKDITPTLLNGFENFPGLPVDYFVATVDGTYHYSLTQIEEEETNHDIFGVPSDFQKVTMTEFIDIMTGVHNE